MLHLKLSPEEFFSRYPVVTDPLVEKSVDVLLPNLRYKNDDVYFIFNNPVKIMNNGKKEFKNEILLKNLALTGEITVMDVKIDCSIIKEERDDGLKVNLKYMDRHYLYNTDLHKFARAVESAILNIDIFDDENENENIEADLCDHYDTYNDDDYDSEFNQDFTEDDNQNNIDYDVDDDFNFENNKFNDTDFY